MVDTDASSHAIGAVLLQQQDNEHPNEWVPIGYWSKTFTLAEFNYSTTERECLSAVSALKTLRPYLEGTTFVARSDHDAFRWMLSIADPYSRLTRWRQTLAEFDFTVQYRSGWVHQVPDAVSRLVNPDSPAEAVDEDLPCFRESVLVSTRSNTRAREAGQPTGESASAEEDDEDRDILEELDDSDLVDLQTGECQPSVEALSGERLMSLKNREILDAQRVDWFCQTMLARQSRKLYSQFEEDEEGILRRRHPQEDDVLQMVMPEALQPRLLTIAHHSRLGGHPGQNVCALA